MGAATLPFTVCSIQVIQTLWCAHIRQARSPTSMAQKSSDVIRNQQPAPRGMKRVLTRSDLILYGLVILTPTAPYPVYGIVQQVSQGHAALSYLVAMVAMLFTAASYAKMSSAFLQPAQPIRTHNARSSHVGFLAGWAMILDYFLIPLLSVIYAA